RLRRGRPGTPRARRVDAGHARGDAHALGGGRGRDGRLGRRRAANRGRPSRGGGSGGRGVSPRLGPARGAGASAELNPGRGVPLKPRVGSDHKARSGAATAGSGPAPGVVSKSTPTPSG